MHNVQIHLIRIEMTPLVFKEMKIETFFKHEMKIYGSDPLHYSKSWSTPPPSSRVDERSDTLPEDHWEEISSMRRNILYPQCTI